jgi:hypothetical protein
MKLSLCNAIGVKAQVMQHIGFTHFLPPFGLFCHSENNGILSPHILGWRKGLNSGFVSYQSGMHETCQPRHEKL